MIHQLWLPATVEILRIHLYALKLTDVLLINSASSDAKKSTKCFQIRATHGPSTHMCSGLPIEMLTTCARYSIRSQDVLNVGG